MKVWELINKIKGTTATFDEILNWMVANRICPLCVGGELDEGEQPELYAMAGKLCDTKKPEDCDPSCYKEFLLTEGAEKGG